MSKLATRRCRGTLWLALVLFLVGCDSSVPVSTVTVERGHVTRADSRMPRVT